MSPDKNVDGDDIPNASDHFQKTKLSSLVGFAVTGAKEGELVTVATRINCKDYTPEAMLLFVQRTLNDLVYPEVINRARNGILPFDFKLINAHVMMYADESKNEVLFNDNVRFLANIIPEDGKELAPMQPRQLKVSSLLLS
jgi:hypothetical protein